MRPRSPRGRHPRPLWVLLLVLIAGLGATATAQKPKTAAERRIIPQQEGVDLPVTFQADDPLVARGHSRFLETTFSANPGEHGGELVIIITPKSNIETFALQLVLVNAATKDVLKNTKGTKDFPTPLIEHTFQEPTGFRLLVHTLSADQLPSFTIRYRVCRYTGQTRNLIEEAKSLRLELKKQDLARSPDLRASARKRIMDLLARIESDIGNQVAAPSGSLITWVANLAIPLHKTGDSQGAITLSRLALRMASDLFGPDHPRTLWTQRNLGVALTSVGRLNDVVDLDRKTMEGLSKVLPERSAKLQTSRLDVAADLVALRRGEEALELAEQVAEALENHSIKNKNLIAWSQQLLAVCQIQAGRLLDARPALESILEERLQSLPHHHHLVQEARQNLAACLKLLGMPHKAIPLYKEALKNRKNSLPKDHPEVLKAMGDLGLCLASVGELPEAINLLEKVLQARRRTLPPDHPWVMHTTSNLSAAYESAGKFKESMKLAEEVLEFTLQKLPKDHVAVLGARSNVGSRLIKRERYRQAADLLRLALDEYREISDVPHPWLLNTRANLASSLSGLGQFQEAIELFESVCESRQQLGLNDNLDHLSNLHELARIYSIVGRTAESGKLIEQVLSTRQRLLKQGSPELAVSLATAANHCILSGDLKRALNILQEAAEAPTLDPRTKHGLRHSRGLAQRELGQIDEARLTLELLIRDLKDPSLHSTRLRLAAQGNLAAVYRGLGRSDDALRVLTELISGAEVMYGKDHPTLLSFKVTKSVLLMDQGLHEDAVQVLKEIIEKAGTRQAPRFLFLAKRGYAEALAHTGRKDDALAILAELLEDSSSPSKNSFQNVDLASRMLYSRLLDAAGRKGEAREQARIVLRTAPQLLDTRAAFLSARTSIAARALSERVLEWCLRSLPDMGVQREVFERMLNLQEQVSLHYDAQRELKHLRPNLVEKVNELTKQGLAIAARIKILSRRADVTQAEWDSAFEARTKTDRKLEALFHEAGIALPQLGQLTLKDLAQRLQPGHALAAYWVPDAALTPDPRIYAFLLNSKGEVRCLDLGSATDTWKIASQIRDAGHRIRLTSAESEGLSTLGKRMFDRCFAPLQKHLESVTQLTIYDQGFLSKVPLDLILDQSGMSLSQRYEIALYPFVARWVKNTPPPTPNAHLLALGAPEFGPDQEPEGSNPSTFVTRGVRAYQLRYPPLPMAGKEVRTIARLFESTSSSESAASVYTGADATRDRVIADSRNARFLHLATHGFAWAAPVSFEQGDEFLPGLYLPSSHERVWTLEPATLCGVALAGANLGPNNPTRTSVADGLLTGQELRLLDLSHCDLAVISACESAMGPRPMAWNANIAASLHIAGASSVITSLWRVPDESTQMLMIRFYENLWDKKLSKRDALKEAKMWIQAQHDSEGRPLSAPIHWAGWVLTGSPH